MQGSQSHLFAHGPKLGKRMRIKDSRLRKPDDRELMGHLFRRAGFGATPDELDVALAKGYSAVVEELIRPESAPEFAEDSIFRYHVGIKESRLARPAQACWLYRMITTHRPLEEKMALFWHSLFATAFSKLNCAKPLVNQISMFREHCLGSYRALLSALSRDPAMIYWLDNYQNTRYVHNENYGRELLELFTLGIGNYSERDVKSCARAFTGWSIKEPVPADQPYGRFDWVFEFRPDLHDYNEKIFLGQRGDFDGDDIIDIILDQPAAARYLAYRLHKFFVSDRPDEDAVAELAEVCRTADYQLREIMRFLLLSTEFRSERSYYSKIKSPVELIASLIRLTGDFQTPRYGIEDVVLSCGYMGQDLLDPPTVEGWHTGTDWIQTASLLERINFAVKQVSDPNMPGTRRLIECLRLEGELSPDAFVEKSLDLMGPLKVHDSTRDALLLFARRHGPLRFGPGPDRAADRRVVELLQLIVSAREFQLT